MCAQRALRGHTMRRLSFLSLLLLTSIAFGWDTMNPALLPTSYGSLDAAAVAGVQAAYEYSQWYEYAGVILEDKQHRFHVAIPDTYWMGDRVGIDYDNDWADGMYTIVADYHTHPCLPFTHNPGVFSTNDVDSTEANHVIGYMGDLCTGDVHRYTPGVSPRDVAFRMKGDPEGEVVGTGAHGETVGRIFIWKQPVIVEQAPLVTPLNNW